MKSENITPVMRPAPTLHSTAQQHKEENFETEANGPRDAGALLYYSVSKFSLSLSLMAYLYPTRRQCLECTQSRELGEN